MSEWKVSSNYTGSRKLYQVYRIRNENEVDHSGNREVKGTFDDERYAQEFCDALNRNKQE